MSDTGLQNLDSAIHTFQRWLKDVHEKLGWEDRRKSYKAFSVVLHALRDQLTVAQSAHLSAQLPLIARGIYYDGFVPARVPLRERHLDQFLDHIRDDFDQAPGGQLIDAERLARAVFEVLNDHVSAGEIEDVRGELPTEIARIWPSPMANGGRRPQSR
jgi:uncharacterized protein (DUF2267 family)